MAEVSLQAGSRGRFEVTLDGKLIFSKAQLGRHTKDGEIVGLMQPSVGPPLDWR